MITSTILAKGVVIAATLLGASCISTVPAYVDFPGPAESAGVTVIVDRAIRAPYGYVGLGGSVSNETDEVLKSCRITLKAYDALMETAGRARVVVEDLQPNETRDYSAKFGDPMKVIRTVLKPEVRLTW